MQKNKKQAGEDQLRQDFSRILLESQIEIQEQILQRTGRELHDNMGQVASLIKINLNTLNLSNVEASFKKVAETLELTRKLITDIKLLSLSLSNNRVEQTGLLKAIETEIARLNKTGLFSACYHLQGSLPDIDKDKTIILYYMALEVFNNIVKHSKAKQINVLINVTEKIFTLVFTDNGLGFNVDEKITCGGNGFHKLHNSARFIGGQLAIQSTPGNGTSITILLPL